MIELNDVTVSIPAHIKTTDLDLRRTMAKAVLGARRRSDSKGEVSLVPLSRINLCVKEGEKVGILGLNGSGKTTLLKTIAGIYPVSRGSVRVSGRIRSFFNLGAGVDPLRSGIENIRLASLYYTQDLNEIKNSTEAIIDFSGLGEFIDMPISTYSAGMLTRLLFAIATAYGAEVLLFDEMIGAGDAAFLEKAERRVKELIDSSACMVLASHSFPIIRQLCDTALWLDRGVARAFGPVEEVIDYYNNHVSDLSEAA